MKNNLQAKIKAVNRVNAYIKANAVAIAAAVAPFIGKKILIGGNELSAKLRDVLAPVFAQAREVGIDIYRNHSAYSLSLVFKVSESTGEYGCVYHEASLYLLDIVDGVATKSYSFDVMSYKSDHDEVHILLTKAALRDAQEQVSRLESQLGPFLRA